MVVVLFFTGCGGTTAASPTPLPTSETAGLATAVSSQTPSPPPPDAEETPAANLPQPTASATPSPLPDETPTATPFENIVVDETAVPPSPTPTATPIGPCSSRNPADDLLTLVTQTYSLSRDYEPQDLITLTDHLPADVTLGFPTQLRVVALRPLQDMITAMQEAGLQPRIYSGYRSYPAQSISWDKWNREEPERAAILSARPGHSEHQLGTTVDFGSPELADIVNDPNVQFHTYFYQTSEGAWLAENAHRYGFTLSYPRTALELTGFYYEPWHFRYVGAELATFLHESETYLTEFQLSTQPEPCIP